MVGVSRGVRVQVHVWGSGPPAAFMGSILLSYPVQCTVTFCPGWGLVPLPS